MEYSAESIVKRLVSEGLDEAVVDVHSYRKSYLKIANSEVDSVVTKFEKSGSIFCSSKKRIATTNIDSFEGKAVESAIANLHMSISNAIPKEDYNGIAKGPFKYDHACGYDKRIANFDNSLMADMAYSAINTALANKATNVAGTLVMSKLDRHLVTSEKVDAHDSCAYSRLSLRLFNKDLSAQDIIASKRLENMHVERFAERIANLARYTRKKGKISSGKYDVIYTQSPGGGLFTNVNSMACMSSVESGSFLSGKLGKIIANRNIDIYDDGKEEELIGTGRFDDEGSPTKDTQLIDKGKFVNYLHNYSTARKYHTKSTGNAGLVDPVPQAMVFKHWKRKKDIHELIRSIDKGIVVTNTWYTRFSNYLTGDFSTVPRDITLFVRNGEVQFAIKQLGSINTVGIRISDNMLRMLDGTTYSADDSTQTSSWDIGGDYYIAPSVLVEGVKVTAANSA